ncbi:ABC-type multidrug transport system, ATPase and permease component [Chthonomonas calidirosea]|uniref:ABC-type multidrug transport system, ATPase and permease components n=1 Tax=Chthonomonas calidirosea (strain DSM 23976 / ICMP 18418 / T49) TaxID=1303518 RepID=S0EYG1_CHTCT|nr:ABC transporter ATP-binding protein [Chthonomonas calidirosea]CCW34882.1 ABC-type multidrug transport system, ATPase and permease components [Chthonomonas calidirosea T49]CEK13524.1 ABC-type multidrug transport system, ATPase and permease component [Chthonomonas calidirosea]
MELFRRLLGYLRPYRKKVALSVLLLLIITFTPIVLPRIIGYTIDVVIPHKNYRALVWIFWGIVGLYALRGIVSFWLNYTIGWLGQRVVFDLRFESYRHLNRLSLSYYDTRQTGKIMARLMGDIDFIQQMISGGFVTFMADMLSVIAILVVLFTMQWRLTLLALAGIPFYVANYKYFIRYIRPLSVELREKWDAMLGALQEKLAGIMVVKAFAREEYETERFMQTVKENFDLGMKQMKLNRRLGAIAQVIRATFTGAVLWYGGALILHHRMEIGALLAFNALLNQLYDPAVRIVDFNVTVQWTIAAMERVFETLDTRPEITDAPDAKPLTNMRGEVEFDHVTFGYERDHPVLHDICLKVAPGEVVAIVGPSGSGKTTLVNLIARFYEVPPGQGTIRIDGVDIRKVKLESIRRQISIVSQESLLFSVSLKENIKYGYHDATDWQIMQAAKMADLHEFILTLPQAYDTKIGEEGIKLSVGQKQRMAIARAALTNPRILILDDATSALDSKTEANVQAALERLMKGRTSFVITHRLSPIMNADKIVVLDQGRIVDIGTHAELVSRPGVYQNLYNEQFRAAHEQNSGIQALLA